MSEPAAAAELEWLARRFADGRHEFVSSPLYHQLCLATAAEPEILAIAAAGRAGQQPPNLLFAAVHFLLLGGARHELAEWYPTVVGDPADVRDPSDVDAAYADFCRQHRAELLELVSTRLVQTNIVARSVLLRLGLHAVAAQVDEPVTLVEVGCSAGAHLCFDRYHYDVGGSHFGDPGSSVRIGSEWLDRTPPPDLDRYAAVGDRVGLDLAPIDARDPVERRWLRALVWPEDTRKAGLLAAALAVVAADPPPTAAGDATLTLPRLAARLPAGRPVVVFHAATLAHVPREARPAFEAAVAGLGARRPLFWLSLEGGADPAERQALADQVRRAGHDPALRPAQHMLRLRRIDGAVDAETVLAGAAGHADWIVPMNGVAGSG